MLGSSDMPRTGPSRAFQKREAEGVMSHELVEAALFDLRKYMRGLFPLEDLVDDALALARQIGHPVYDCVYLILAARLGNKMITADAKFADKLGSTAHGRHIVHLADWRP